MIKTLAKVAIAGILRAKIVSGIVGAVNTAATLLSTLILLTAFIELLPLLRIAMDTHESARPAPGGDSLVV